MKHLLNTIITNIFHPVRMCFVKFFIIITRRTHLFAVDNNIIIGIAFFTMIFEPFSTYTRTIRSNHEFRNATFIVRRSVFTCLFFNYIASDICSRIKAKLTNKMHTIFPYFGKTRRSISIITVCTEPKNFVIKINIKQNVMIMRATMKLTIFTTAKKTNTTAILTTKIFHKSLMKFLAQAFITWQMIIIKSASNEISRRRRTGFVDSTDSPLSAIFETTADALFTRTTNETAIASKLRVRGKATVKTIMLFSIFSNRSFNRVHKNRIITNHINHLYRLYQD